MSDKKYKEMYQNEFDNYYSEDKLNEIDTNYRKYLELNKNVIGLD